MPFQQLSSSSDSLAFHMDLEAPPHVIFHAWTLPCYLTVWFPPEAKTETILGGAYVFHWPRQGWTVRGHYTDWWPGERLAFTWHWDHDPDPTENEVRITLKWTKDGTTVDLIHGPFPDTEAGREDREKTAEGWSHFLPRLEAMLSGSLTSS